MEQHEWFIEVYYILEDGRAKCESCQEIKVIDIDKQEAIQQAKHILNKMFNQFTIKFLKITAEKKEDIELW